MLIKMSVLPLMSDLLRQTGKRTFVTNRNGSLWKMTIDHVDLSLIPQAKILSILSFFNNPRIDNDAMVRCSELPKNTA